MVKIVFAILVLLSIANFLAAKTSVFKNCRKNSKVKVTGVSISPCIRRSRKKICSLRHGNDHSISITFKSKTDEEIKSLTPKIMARVNGKWLPFTGIGADATEVLETPLKKGDKHTFKFKLPVKKAYPAVKAIIRFFLKDGDKKIGCFIFPTSILEN